MFKGPLDKDKIKNKITSGEFDLSKEPTNNNYSFQQVKLINLFSSKIQLQPIKEMSNKIK